MVCQDCYEQPAERGEYTCAACAAKEPTVEQLERMMSDGVRESVSERVQLDRDVKEGRTR